MKRLNQTKDEKIWLISSGGAIIFLLAFITAFEIIVSGFSAFAILYLLLLVAFSIILFIFIIVLKRRKKL